MTPTCGTTPVAISNYLRQQATAPLDRIYYLDRWMESIKSSSHPPTQPSRSLLPHGNGEKEKIPPPMKRKQRRNAKKLRSGQNGKDSIDEIVRAGSTTPASDTQATFHLH